MVSGRREQGIFRSVEPDEHVSAFETPKGSIRTPLGRLGLPSWWSGKAAIFVIALIVMFAIIQVQPFDRVEESNCLAMLLFCTILWATEVSLLPPNVQTLSLTLTRRLYRYSSHRWPYRSWSSCCESFDRQMRPTSACPQPTPRSKYRPTRVQPEGAC